MFTSFSHQDIRDRWHSIELRQDILYEERGYYCFKHQDSEFQLWRYFAEASPQVDMLQFWISCFGVEGMDASDVDRYLAAGWVEQFSNEQFAEWFRKWMDELLPEYRFAPPAPLAHQCRIFLGGWLHECVIGLNRDGYWGMRILSTA